MQGAKQFKVNIAGTDLVIETGLLAQQAVAAGVVLVVRLEVLGESRDLLRQDRNLNLAGTRVTVMALELALDGSLVNFHFPVSF